MKVLMGTFAGTAMKNKMHKCVIKQESARKIPGSLFVLLLFLSHLHIM